MVDFNQPLDWHGMLQPVLDLCSAGQLQMMLMVALPVLLDGIVTTGIYVVDMFIYSLLGATLMSAGHILYRAALVPIFRVLAGRYHSVALRIDYYRDSVYYEEINEFYTAVSWMISTASAAKETGRFVMLPRVARVDDDELPEYATLPDYADSCWITYEGHRYYVSYSTANVHHGPAYRTNDNTYGDQDRRPEKAVPPSIVLETDPRDQRSVQWLRSFLDSVNDAYRAYRQSIQRRYRYTYDDYWMETVELHGNGGLGAVALDAAQESTLRMDLSSFLAGREVYAQLGTPYRRGYLFYGKPGTGKSTLIAAIAAELNRSLYFLNLRDIKSDQELFQAFDSVPKYQIIVFEDIDAMSPVCHRRAAKGGGNEEAVTPAANLSLLAAMTDLAATQGSNNNNNNSHSSGNDNTCTIGDLLRGNNNTFTLSALLACLDGQVMNEGNIVIMTSNHPERLDPALIRAGRIDLKLELGYATRHQLQRMYHNVLTAMQHSSSLKENEKGEDGNGQRSTAELVRRLRKSDSCKQTPAETPTTTLVAKPASQLSADWLATVPERLLPPCECMRLMLLYRESPHLIPQQIDALVTACRQLNYQSPEEMEEQQQQQQQQLLLGQLTVADASDEKAAVKPNGLVSFFASMYF